MSRDYEKARDIEDAEFYAEKDEAEKQMYAFQVFINKLATEADDELPTDAGYMDRAYHALARVDEIEEANDSLQERVEELEEENIELRAQLKADRDTEPGSKKALAMRLARNECLRQLAENVERNSMSGEVKQKETSMADVPQVREQARADGVELQYKTIDDAFTDLEEQYDCFEKRDGSGTSSGKNKRVVVRRGAEIPRTLWTAYHDDTGAKVPDPSTYDVIGEAEGVDG